MIMKQLNNPVYCNSAVLHNGNTTELEATELQEEISVHLHLLLCYWNIPYFQCWTNSLITSWSISTFLTVATPIPTAFHICNGGCSIFHCEKYTKILVSAENPIHWNLQIIFYHVGQKYLDPLLNFNDFSSE